MLKALKALNPYSKQYMKLMVPGAIMSILFALFALVEPKVTGDIVDGVLTGKSALFVLQGCLLMIGATLIRSVLRRTFLMNFEKASQNIIFKLREDMYLKLQSLDFNFFDRTPVGQTMSKLTGDIEAVRHFYAWSIHETIFHAAIFIFALINMIIISPILTCSLIVVIPFIMFLSLRLSKHIKPTFTHIREQFSRLNILVQENISGNRIVKAFTQEDFEIKKFDQANKDFERVNLESAKVQETFLPYLDAIAVFFNVIVLLLGGLMVIEHTLSIGSLVAFNRLLWMINNPLRMLGKIINDIQNFSASYEKIDEFLKEECELKPTENIVTTPKINGYVTFKNVSFQFEDEPVLKNIDFSVEPGQTVAILGATGSGKSSIINLISHFYDATEGEILIDGNPITHYDHKTLRSSIAVAMQDIFLFSDTIEKNIAYGIPEFEEKEILWASHVAGIHEFIEQFEDGFETVIGERGVGLSGGQKQRIALARAIILNPSILILDDTTSAVDVETEYFILTELKKINTLRTTFMIAHRISSVKDANLILVLDQGRIVERGTHTSLLASKGYYYQIFTQQMGDFDPKTATILNSTLAQKTQNQTTSEVTSHVH